MAGRGGQTGPPCDGCKSYLDDMDRKLKCLFSHMNSSFRHGMTIIHIPDSHCGKDLSCAGTKAEHNVFGLQGGSAYPSDTLRGSHDHANESSASERPASSSSHRNAASEESGEDSQPELQSLQSDHVEILSRHCFISSGCHLTPELKEELAELVKKIRPEIPVLVAQMKKSNVKHPGASLVISKGYAEEYFPAKSENITLEWPGGKKWHVRLHVRPEGRGYILCGHWVDVVREIKLKLNNICVFQPIKSSDGFRLMFHVLREACSRSMRGNTHRSNKCGIRKVTYTVHANEKSSHRGKSPLLDHHGRQEPHVLLDCGEPSQPPSYVVLGSTKLTPAQEKMVEEKVQAIGTEGPIFVATMTEQIAGANGSYSLDFKTQYAAAHLPDGKQTLTLYQAEWSKTWRVMLRDRQMLPGVFREFAHDNLLWTEDLCLFVPMKNGEVAMMVHIIRS
ncbi:hypothetical protein EJB05_05628 [Eragrostis curvula]|uniref:TF-B3 domain-containing protein n=1 Tax=Eragrostis curvula TaxID=38414 RepID=A0A5J9WFC7_9POAL|nr:hypothetical protein EJB05_05628 [Eragrostis curvula]